MSPAAAAAALGALLLVAGRLFGIAALYVPGIALAATALGFGAWILLAARGAKVRRVPGPPSVEEGVEWPLRVEFQPGWLPPPGGEIVDPLLAAPVPIRALGPLASGLPGLERAVTFPRRGRVALGPIRVVVRDPLAVAARTVDGADPGEVLVLPRIHPVVAEDGGGAGRGRRRGYAGSDAADPGRAAAELELDILRPYRPGTPATRIHWPTLARTGQLMERRLVADDRSRPLVVVDARMPVDELALDAAVRAAASLVFHLALGGGCAVLLPGERHPVHLGPELRGWPSLHARLAVLGAAAADPRLDERGGRRSTIVWVGARAPGSWPAAVSRAAYLVVPGRLPELPVAFTVAGCSGHAVGGATRAEAA